MKRPLSDEEIAIIETIRRLGGNTYCRQLSLELRKKNQNIHRSLKRLVDEGILKRDVKSNIVLYDLKESTINLIRVKCPKCAATRIIEDYQIEATCSNQSCKRPNGEPTRFLVKGYPERVIGIFKDWKEYILKE